MFGDCASSKAAQHVWAITIRTSGCIVLTFPPNLDLVCPGSCSALFLTSAHDHRTSFVGHVQITLHACRATGTGFLELSYLVLSSESSALSPASSKDIWG